MTDGQLALRDVRHTLEVRVRRLPGSLVVRRLLERPAMRQTREVSAGSVGRGEDGVAGAVRVDVLFVLALGCGWEGGERES